MRKSELSAYDSARRFVGLSEVAGNVPKPSVLDHLKCFTTNSPIRIQYWSFRLKRGTHGASGARHRLSEGVRYIRMENRYGMS